MCEAVVHRLPVAGGIAGGGTPEDVVAVGSLSDERRTSMISHAGEQVAGCFVGVCKRHVIRLSELVQQVGTVEVLIAELLNCSAVGKAGAADTTIRAVAGCDGVLNRAVLAVGIAGSASEAVTSLSDEVGIAIHHEGIALTLAVGVVCEAASACVIHQLDHLAEVVVGEAAG